MSQNLQNFAKFQKFQLDNLVDFENAAKRIFTCKDRCRYSKNANICKMSKNKSEQIRRISAEISTLSGANVGIQFENNAGEKAWNHDTHNEKERCKSR